MEGLTTLLRLADSSSRENRDLARQLAIPMGADAMKSVEEVCRCHECYVCGEDMDHVCPYCEQPICPGHDASGMTDLRFVDPASCGNCTLSMNNLL